MKYVGTDKLAICNFTLAVNRLMKKEGQPDADFIPIVSLGKIAEFCGKYFSKGLKVAIRGRIQTRNWEKDGVKQYVTEIIAEQVDFADGKKQNNTQQGGLEPEVNQGFFPIDDNENPFL
jgi:single-strand DNA-binding protein